MDGSPIRNFEIVEGPDGKPHVKPMPMDSLLSGVWLRSDG